MDVSTILLIAQSATALAEQLGGGKVHDTLTPVEQLEGIIGTALKAYQDETGQPLDLNKLKPAPDDSI